MPKAKGGSARVSATQKKRQANPRRGYGKVTPQRQAVQRRARQLAGEAKNPPRTVNTRRPAVSDQTRALQQAAGNIAAFRKKK